jgi:thioredoxin-like negative regulator of GroEL
MKKLLIPLFAMVAAFALAGDFPKGSPDFAKTFTNVKARAAKSGKPIVVVFSATWCGPCVMMKQEVYPSAEVKALHDKFEWAYLDVDEGSTAKVAEEFGVNGIPHVQFLKKDGSAISKSVGSLPAKDFAALLEKVLKSS